MGRLDMRQSDDLYWSVWTLTDKMDNWSWKSATEKDMTFVVSFRTVLVALGNQIFDAIHQNNSLAISDEELAKIKEKAKAACEIYNAHSWGKRVKPERIKWVSDYLTQIQNL